MFLKHAINKSKLTLQNGSALVLALFIIVIVTLLGTALVRMISSNAETIAYEVLGTRAYQAAQAGAQIKLKRLFPLSGPSECTANSTYDFSGIDGLDNCQAAIVDCTADRTVDGITYYTITSTGQCDFLGGFTSRTIEVKARNVL
ncbi:PilX N-terminal domain-containing pilus assembly protein [Colwelliaceae bacterium MEBiC 14330]